jgi:hypothetical protein
MNWRPDDLKHPTGGETIDQVARDSIRLAHDALDRFPDLVRKHKVIAGGAAISSSLVILAGVAIAKRMRSGQTGEEAVAGLTEEELQHLELVKRRARVSADEASDEPDVAPERASATTNGASE